MGDRLESFERKAANYCGVKHAIGVGPTDAIFLILKALDIGPGDEVITATNSFIALLGGGRNRCYASVSGCGRRF